MSHTSHTDFLLVRRSGFGMPESPYSLHVVVHNWMVDYGLEQSKFDPCVYIRAEHKCAEWPFVFVVAWELI